MAIKRSFKPFSVALKGKGVSTLLRRVWSIGQRYGLTAAKMDRALAQLSQILKQFNCRATLPVTAVALARNSGVIQKYQAQGIEFAIHGYRHVDYSQLALEEQFRHLRQAAQLFQDHGIHFGGFRCPYLRWNELTLEALSQNGFNYDSSTSLFWDIGEEHATDAYRQVLGFYGARPAVEHLALPHLDPASQLVRIPYCLPDDESLVERLRWRSLAEMNQVWPAMFRQIHESEELFVLGLHPERVGACSDALVATLQQVRAAGPAVWCTRLSEIADWWKARYAAVVNVAEIQDGVFQLTVQGSESTALMLRGLDVRTEAEPWFNGYRRARGTACVVGASKRPFIGVSPGVDPALISLLRQQGYVVETSLKPQLYPFYLSDGSFRRQDERRLIERIEGADWPLVRLGRWPNGARSAVAITGDIDALTLWDYGLRPLEG